MDAVPPPVHGFLSERDPEARELALWLRDVVLAAEPDLAERVYPGWDGIGYRHPDAGYVCGIFPRDDGVRLLFEHGARLDDPDGLLEGQGSQTRHTVVRAPDPRLAEQLGRLVHETVAQRLFER